MAKKYFGTDGMRGRVGVEPMTAATVMKLGWAAGRVLAKEGNRDVLLAKIPVFQGICLSQRWKRVCLQPESMCACSARCRLRLLRI